MALDQIAAMALPTLPDWSVAHQIFESITGQWARSNLTCVIAEGSGSHDEVSRVLDQAPPAAVAVTVVTTAPFEVAFARARSDVTRGLSQERSFLSEVYERWSTEMGLIQADVLLDTSVLDIVESVKRISGAIDSARNPPRPDGG